MADAPDEFTPIESERPTGSGFDGEDFLFHLYRGSELLQDNCVSEAKEELERALAMQPRDIEGQGLLGVVYFRLGLYPRAMQIYEELVQACPREPTPRVNLALCYLKTGQSQQARDSLEEVTRIAPDHLRAWGYLGLVYERMGDYAKATAAFERAGQPHMVQRMQQHLEQQGAVPIVERDELRQAAALAVQELEGEDPAGPFLAIRDSDPSLATEGGHWRATEPGEEPVPVRSARGFGLTGRFGPAVPSLSDSLAPLSARPRSLPAVPEPPQSAHALASGLLLPFPKEPGVSLTPDGLGLVTVQQSFVARADALRVLLPAGRAFKLSTVQRRTRGRELDEPLGGLSGPLIALDGPGNVVLAPADERALTALSLQDEFVYVREHQLVGFEASLRHENGRFSVGPGDHVPMVQLTGRGAVLLEVRGSLRALTVSAERPVILRFEHVLGWTGRLLPNALRLEESPGGRPGFIGFSGDGSVFLELAP